MADIKICFSHLPKKIGEGEGGGRGKSHNKISYSTIAPVSPDCSSSPSDSKDSVWSVAGMAEGRGGR
jgi:hypothetical protein